jgi:hypothetical protein
MSWSNKEIISYGHDLLGLWKKRNAEVLSCFDLNRLQDAMSAFADLEMGRSVLQELYRASEQPRDAEAVAQKWVEIYNTIFVTLYDRGVLKFVVEDVPAEAQSQLDRMADEVASYNPVETEEEVVAPVVQVDPVAQCVKEFHEMGSNQFRAKYLNNVKNRPIYELAVDRGLL